MVLAATVLLFQFAAIQPSAPATGLDAHPELAIAASEIAGQVHPNGLSTLAASNGSKDEPPGLGNFSHIHLFAAVSTSQPGPAKGDGTSSSGLKLPAPIEGAGSLTGIIAAPLPAAPLPPVKAGRNEIRKTSRMWAALTIAQHSAAAFDAWSTRRALSAGGRYEADPLMRPLAKSPAIYGAIQAGPVVLDYIGRRMSRSENKWMHRLWWVPQSAATAGFLFSGSHNLIHSR